MKASKIIKPKESLQGQQIKTPVPSGSQVLFMLNRQKGFVNLMYKVEIIKIISMFNFNIFLYLLT
ncbi:MAG TPA: hypothetical protein VF084_08230 [Nitrososphaeraceae archaeon]